ncbi:hypothetical protein CGRA01v4_14425 [Colletotrichum graminicola]|uniref:Uncharacterized protein n=1 Tax=Colletotrichum graminicola (strain M1.001 / M2 / FGSC 10212) TaxID=645133 RepID=E3Q4J2_COLGM|nr:uncharacterized protein GLRG_01151 [Colletotrichum graminicola M1.001]EFQ26007.1 hypothetical protein GLRG_01151 [Colletotrichum graminicola M1.001]WDK23134.1 hypothetical protein CGRA01v4_14425 [Colletotrichum graminicola]
MRIPQRLPAILALTASIIILLSSILCLAFQMTAFTTYMEYTDGGTFLISKSIPRYGPFSYFYECPLHLMPVLRPPLVVAGSFGLVIGLAITWMIAASSSRQRPWQLYHGQRVALITVLGANALLATASMIYVLVQHGRSSHIDPGYILPGVRSVYDKEYFSLEEWTCEIPYYLEEFGSLILVLQCVGERVSRISIAGMCFFSLALAGLLVWDLNNTQVAVTRPKTRNSWEDDDWA